MYIPDLYLNKNKDSIVEFIHENSFGILINQTQGTLWATHIPLEYEAKENGSEILFGHLSKKNIQWKGFLENDEVLVVFSGPHSYISSSWYDHENVPTWNYSAVHVYGKIKIIEGPDVINYLKKQIDKYEKHSACPVRLENLSTKTMLQTEGIVTFEIEINKIQAVEKLSQNRDSKNYNAIIEKLENSSNQQSIEVAKKMKKIQK